MQVARAGLGAWLVALSGCQGGETAGLGPEAVKPGVLAVAVTGLPAGAAAGLTLSGPGGFSQAMTESATITGLIPGDYSLSSAPVSFDGDGYLAEPAAQSVAVRSSQTATISVTYRMTTGRLVLSVDGVAPGLADVLVTGPAGFSRIVTGPDTLKGLPNGTYQVRPSPVTVDGDRYGSPADSLPVLVAAGPAPSPAAVQYQLASGRLDLVLTGVPAGATGMIAIDGPGGFSLAVTGSQLIKGLLPGQYTLQAAAIASEGDQYEADIVPAVVRIAPSPVALGVAATYRIATGGLAIDLTGLPGTAPGGVTVTGPGGFSAAVTADTIIRSLVPGTYTIAAGDVIVAGSVYQPQPATATVTVTAGKQPILRTVAYALGVGNLQVTVKGLPAGAIAAVSVSGPGGFGQSLPGSATLAGLVPGTYVVAAGAVVAGGHSYVPTPASQNALVALNATTTASVTYVATTGALAVTVHGLPGGAVAAVTVTGPGGFSQAVTATRTLTGLAPGNYGIAAATTTAGGSSYLPAPASQAATVTAGATASASVGYTVAPATSFNLVIDGMYATQAAARYDGTTPIIAGRNAYLRVFVKANLANTSTPAVRVRLYSGATLIQTSTLNPPAASVPTTISEGSLSGSWNLVIPAATVQPGLRILADVDPANAVLESSDTDNTFPAGGTPFALDVRAVPAWNVRFVPVLQSVNSLQGNVTAANVAAFLADPLKLLPVGAYSADVRAVYTTTAPVLQSGNGNGAWGTILSEVAALRSADASSRYYYGVVKTNYGSGVAGIGYVGGSLKTALGWDALPSGSGVMAHELGHNMGRSHAPCGGAGGPDPAYPYAGGILGTYGLDLATLSVKAPTTNFDLMGYCSPDWISDYTWSGLISYRQAGPTNAPPASAGAVSGLLVWGRIGPDGVVFEPAFRVAPPALEPVAGSSGYRVEGLAADSRVLFTHPVELERPMADAGGDERHFVAVLPLDAAQDQELVRLRLVTPAGPVNRLSLQAMAQAGRRLVLRDPGAAVTSPNPAQATVSWDGATYPMAMVRDAATGEILSFARGGAATLWTGSRRFDVTFSDGVRSVVQRLARP